MKQYKAKYPIKDQTKDHLLRHYYLTILDETGIDIKDKSRKREQQDLQKIFCKFASWHKNYTLTFIGHFLGKDHATILHCCKKYDELYATDVEFRRKAEHFHGRFHTIDGEQDVPPVKKALSELVERLSEKTAARVYAAAVDILEGTTSVRITRDEIHEIIDRQTKSFEIYDE